MINAKDKKPKFDKKHMVAAMLGGIFGFAAVMALRWFLGEPLVSALGGSRTALAAVALWHFGLASFVGFGAAFPDLGARILNVADSEGLHEDRPTLLLSAILIASLGVSLMLFALARGPDFSAGVVSPQIAAIFFVLFILLLLGSGVLASRWGASADELDLQLSYEGFAWAFGFSWFVLMIWAAADFLGLGAQLTPVDVVTVLAAMVWVGFGVALGRRGLLKQ